MNPLSQFGIVPVDFATVSDALGHYRSPRDKVSALERDGQLIRLKKGAFVVSPQIAGAPLSPELIANHLCGPSYVSLETALAFYGLIPESVHATRSMTLKRARSFKTPLGLFDYTRVPLSYFPIGVRRHTTGDVGKATGNVAAGVSFLIASPEKALCDMVFATSNLRLQSAGAARTYFEENLRVDFDVLDKIDVNVVRQCAATGAKKHLLLHVAEFLENL